MVTVPIFVFSAAVTVHLDDAIVKACVGSSSMSETRVGETKRCGGIGTVGDDGRAR